MTEDPKLPTRRLAPLAVAVIPSISKMLGDAQTVLGNELAALKDKSVLGGLSDRDVVRFKLLIESLVRLNKEGRESSSKEAEAVASMSPEELEAKVKELLSKEPTK